jgi:hypothetical protein
VKQTKTKQIQNFNSLADFAPQFPEKDSERWKHQSQIEKFPRAIATSGRPNHLIQTSSIATGMALPDNQKNKKEN